MTSGQLLIPERLKAQEERRKPHPKATGGGRRAGRVKASHVYTTCGTEDSMAGTREGTRETLAGEEAPDAKFPVQRGAEAGALQLGSGCAAHAY